MKTIKTAIIALIVANVLAIGSARACNLSGATRYASTAVGAAPASAVSSSSTVVR